MHQLRNLNDLKRCTLRARDGEIGVVREVYFDDQHWTVRYLVVRTGGWLLGREVLIAPRLIRSVDQEAQLIAVDLTREQVEHSPPVSSEQPVSRHYEAEYYRHYGLDPYWSLDPLGAPGTPRPMPVDTTPLREPAHPHLRSSDEVSGYRIVAHDGELGKVEDFAIDDRDWSIGYVVIDTRKWLPGKTVLIAPAWIEAVDWAARSITVDLDRGAIESAPPYEPSRVISRDYEIRLYAHYGKTPNAEGGRAARGEPHG